MSKSDGVSPFVGESRILMVDGLLAIYDSVVEEGQPRWVSLEAPSGWGKTRVVREFYSRLAGRQSKPAYWPMEIEEPDRKVTYPSQFVRAARSLPIFLWWGIPCSRQVGHLDTRQLEIHEPYVRAAWRKLISRRKHAYLGFVAAIRRVMRAGLSELVARLVAWIAGTTVPGAGLVVDLAYDRLRDAYGTHKVLASSSTIDDSQPPDLVEVTVDLLVQVSKPGLPIVIFVDDFHRANDAVVELISEILSRSGPIMVVSTTWPDILDNSPHLSPLAIRHIDRLYRVEHTKPPNDPFPAGAGLTELDEDARASILCTYYPQVESTTRTELLQRYINPLELELFCQLAKFRSQPREYFANGELTLSLSELERLPQSIRELRRDLWRELPSPVRFALAVAHVVTPANINPAEAAGDERWVESLLHEVIRNLQHPESERVVAAFEEAPSAYAWVRAIDDHLRAFAETTQKEIAADDGYAFLEDQLDDPRTKILDTLASSVARTWGDGPETVNRSRSVLALYAEGFIADQQVVADAIRVQLEELMRVPQAFRERERLFDKFISLDSAGISDETSFMVRISAAQILGEAGRMNEAIPILKELSIEMSSALDPYDQFALICRNNWGASLGESGQVEEAIEVYDSLLGDCVPVLGPEHPLVLTAASNMAHWLSVDGRLGDAIAVYQTMLSSGKSSSKLNRRDLLIPRNNLANLLGEIGRIDEAIASYDQLLIDRQRLLGSDHPDTLTTRNNRALWLARAGRINEACSEFSEVHAGRGEALGAEHTATLAARANLAHWLAEAGRLDASLAEYRIVVAEHCQVLGADDPKALMARAKLAQRLGEAGRRIQAATMLEELLTDQQRILGSDDPDTLHTRYLLASFVGELGDPEQAVQMYRDLLVDCERVLGADHLDTIATRNNLAGWLAESGQVREAIASFEDLRRDVCSVLGTIHPVTLAIQNSLAELRREQAEEK